MFTRHTLWLRTKEVSEDAYLFVDSRGALDCFESQQPVFDDVILQCKEVIKGRSVSFMWVSSHAGINTSQWKGTVYGVASEDTINIQCTHNTIKQIKTRIKNNSIENDKVRLTNSYVGHSLRTLLNNCTSNKLLARRPKKQKERRSLHMITTLIWIPSGAVSECIWGGEEM